MENSVFQFSIRNVLEVPKPSEEAEKGIFSNFTTSAGEGAACFTKLIFDATQEFPAEAELTFAARLKKSVLVPEKAPSTRARPGSRPNSAQSTGPKFEFIDITPEVGMTGRLTLVPGGQTKEQYYLRIKEVREGKSSIVADVIRPTNAPICPARSSLGASWEGGTFFDIAPKVVPWYMLATVGSLVLPSDILLNENIGLLRLSPADVTELEIFRRYWFGLAQGKFPIGTCAIAIKQYHPHASSFADGLLLALQLFKSGHLEQCLKFHFEVDSPSKGNGQIIPSGVIWPTERSYRDDGSRLVIETDEMESLLQWIRTFHSRPIESGSVMDRVLLRFSRTFSEENQSDRITDAVIGLEMLVLPGKQTGETGYRVSERASFLISSDPMERLTIARKVTEAYDFRSAAVHSGGRKAPTIEQADEIVDYLRKCIRRVMEARDPLAKEFCGGNRDDEKNKFYKALVAFGDFERAQRHWEESQVAHGKGGRYAKEGR